MDGEKTAPFSLGPSAAHTDRAVLLLHGFTGSPWEVRPLAESLAARGYHVHAPLLPGHGGTGDAMAFVTWRDWERASVEALDSLLAFEHVAVAGLSMGALLALLLAARRPARVAALALMAPACRLRQGSARLLRALRVVPGLPVPSRWVSKRGSDLEDDQARHDNPVMQHFPVARLYDLFMLQDLVSMGLSQVKARALVVVSRHDHVVDLGAARELQHRLPGATLVELQRGFHIVTRDTDRARVCVEVAGFFEATLSAPAAQGEPG